MTDTPTHVEPNKMVGELLGDGPLCWTAGCDDEAEWQVVLYNFYPFDFGSKASGPVMPPKWRCRTHTFEVRAWWLNRHNGEVIITKGVK